MWGIWLCCSLCLVSSHYHRNAAATARSGQLRLLGVMPFEPDVLPFAVIQRIYEQQSARAVRQLPWLGHSSKPGLQSAKLVMGKIPPNRVRQFKRQKFSKSLQPTQKTAQTMSSQQPQLRLERSRKNSKLFNLYDADGEHLLDLKFHVGNPPASAKMFIPIGNSAKVEWMAPTVANATTTTTTAATTTAAATAMRKQWQRKQQSPLNKAEKHVPSGCSCGEDV